MIQVARAARIGVTLVELLVVITITSIMVGLLLAAVLSAREAARRMTCSNNLKQIGLAVHNYHSTFNQLPQQSGGTYRTGADNHGIVNRMYLSWLVGITPFVEQQALWEHIRLGDALHPPMGPSPWVESFAPWTTEVATFRCPSDPGTGEPAVARSNYAACQGDHMRLVNSGGKTHRGWYQGPNDDESAINGDQVFDDLSVAVEARETNRGVFWARHITTFRDILDGHSNTIMAGEICTSLGKREVVADNELHVDDSLVDQVNGLNPRVCLNRVDPGRPGFLLPPPPLPRPQAANRSRGVVWAYGTLQFTGFQTILPPNQPSCYRGHHDSQGVSTAGSRHSGGAHVLMCDGAVAFISNSIDAGSPDATVVAGGPSPFGVWGAMGTRAQSEGLNEDH